MGLIKGFSDTLPDRHDPGAGFLEGAARALSRNGHHEAGDAIAWDRPTLAGAAVCAVCKEH